MAEQLLHRSDVVRSYGAGEWMLLEVTAPAPAAASEFDEENARGNNGGNNGAVAGWRWPTRDLRKCLKRQRPALVVAGRRRLRSRRSRVRIAAGALEDDREAHSTERLLDRRRQRPGRSCIVRKELGLALRTDRCDTNRKVVSGRTFTAIPFDRRADRVTERPEGQACRDRPPVVSQQHPADPWVALRNPEGKLRPRLDACRKKILVRDPRETCGTLRNGGALLEHPAHRQRGWRTDCVEDSDAGVLG